MIAYEMYSFVSTGFIEDTADAVSRESTAVGPTDKHLEDPRNGYTKAGMTDVYNPYTAGRPATSEYEIDCGTSTLVVST